jgi:hypothetical protein
MKYKNNIEMTWIIINSKVGKHKNTKSIPECFSHKTKLELAKNKL